VTFTRKKDLRIELYLDSGDKEQNKKRFDQLLARKGEIEAIVGEPLEWERREDGRACRVAIYTTAQVEKAQNPVLLNWAAQKTVAFYNAFKKEFSAE
jgi:hypothetical protein